MKTNNFIIITTVALSMLLMRCNGGSTEIGNARSVITGSISENNEGVCGVQVQLVAEHFIPGNDTTGNVFTGHTDYTGAYTFHSIPHGSYYLNAKKSGKCMLNGPFEIQEENEVLPDETLHPAAKMTLYIDGSDSIDVAYIQGTVDLYKATDGILRLNTVPEGQIRVIGYVAANGTPTTITTQNSQLITVTVSARDSIVASFDNTAPRITTTIVPMGQVIMADSTEYSLDLDAYDAENDEFHFRIVRAPDGMIIDSLSGEISWRPATTIASGSYGVSVAVTDRRGASSTIAWNITVAHGLLIVDTIPIVKTIHPGMTYIVKADIGDTDGINAYRFAWGDSDTTLWQKTPEALHAWLQPGEFVITYQVQYKVDGSYSDWMGKTTVQTFDTVPPVLQIGDTLIYLEVGQPFIDPGSYAYDTADGTSCSVTVEGSVDTSKPGRYTLIYSASDLSGNTVQAARGVIVTDIPMSPPVILLVYGDSLIMLQMNTGWVEPGFTVVDAYDGTISADKVIVDSTELIANLGTPGIYVVTYTVTNSLGLTTIAERQVMVVVAGTDRTSPVILLLGNNPDTIILASGEYREPGYFATDDQDGDLTSSVIRSGAVDQERIGKNTLVYSVTDAAGNTTNVPRTVWVVPDTLTVDLLVRYGVPAPEPLPNIAGTFNKLEIDGDAGIRNSSTGLILEWDQNDDILSTFSLMVQDTPTVINFVTCDCMQHTFAAMEPELVIEGTGIDGIDGNFYVTFNDGKLFWVEKTGSYALIWSKEE